MDELLTDKEAILAEFRKKLLKAQTVMKQIVDTK